MAVFTVISGRYCDQLLPLYSHDETAGVVGAESEYTRTCPAEMPFSSLKGLLIATRVPSEDIDSEYPDKSSKASPSISGPICSHAGVTLL